MAQVESVDDYLSKHHVLTFLQDAVQQLLDYRDENPKVVTNRFFCDYFTSVKEGNHVLFRDYQFIHSTPHNRTSFIQLFLKCFRHIGKRGDLLTIAEYSSLIKLLCADFPFEMVQKTAFIILMEDAANCLVGFSDFVYAFQVQFYYEDFLKKTDEVYRTLLTSPPKDTVVVPTSEPPASHEERDETPNDTVDFIHLYKLLCPIIEKAVFSCPSMAAIHHLLAQSKRVSYYGLLIALAKSEAINQEIGILPSRDELYEGLEEPPDFTETSKSLLDTASSTTSLATVATVSQTEVKEEKVEKPVVKKFVKKVIKKRRKSSSNDDDDDDSSTDSSDD